MRRFKSALPVEPLSLLRSHCPGCGMPSQSSLRDATARVAAPSVCFAAARILLAAAPTAPPCFRHWRRSSPLPQRGSHWQAGSLPTGRLRPDKAQKGGPCYRGQQLLDKRSLSSCCWPRQRSTTVSETSCFARPVESYPACQRLPLWGSWREAPERAHPGTVTPAA